MNGGGISLEKGRHFSIEQVRSSARIENLNFRRGGGSNRYTRVPTSVNKRTTKSHRTTKSMGTREETNGDLDQGLGNRHGGGT